MNYWNVRRLDLELKYLFQKEVLYYLTVDNRKLRSPSYYVSIIILKWNS